jgi:hypothetical protein
MKKYRVVARETELTRHVLPGIAEKFPFLGICPMHEVVVFLPAAGRKCCFSFAQTGFLNEFKMRIDRIG